MKPVRKGHVLALLALLALVFLGSGCDAINARREIKEANRLYKDGKFEEAAKRYESALAVDPSLAGRMFNALREPFALRALDNARLITAAGLAMRTATPSACREPVGALEAHVPWLLDFLTTRRDCYQATGDPRLTAAADDLNEFLAHEAQPFSALVPIFP